MLKASDALRGFQRSGPLGYLQQVIYHISYVIFYFKLHYMNILQNHVLHDKNTIYSILEFFGASGSLGTIRGPQCLS
jgi:hypothetical protein